MCDDKCKCEPLEYVAGEAIINPNYEAELLKALTSTFETLYAWDALTDSLKFKILNKISDVVDAIDLA